MNSSEENVDINSRVGNHNENMEVSQTRSDAHLEEFKKVNPNFDFDGSDFCHCGKNNVEVDVEFDGFLRVTHIECGKIMLDGDYPGALYMGPIKMLFQHGTTHIDRTTEDSYVFFAPVMEPNVLEADCGA